MLKNYLKIAWRNIQRNKGYTFITVVGLGIGMAASILILIWVQFELSVDRYHEHSDRIYAVWRNNHANGEVNSWDYTPAPYVPALKEQYPEVEEATRITEWDPMLISFEANSFYEKLTFTEPGFFKMFRFEVLEGDPIAAMEQPESIVLTESLAQKLFGTTSVLGKTVTIEKQLDFEVRAVVADFPGNSTLQFTGFLPFGKLEQMGWVDDFWGNNSYRSFAMLRAGTSLESFNAKFKSFTADNTEYDDISDFLFPFRDLHLKSKFENGQSVGGKIELIRMFSIVSFIVLIIAGINFVNLSTAQSDRRSKEVGIRKISGAQKEMLIGQFLAESTMVALSAYLIALVLVSLTFSSFRDLIGQELQSPLSQPFFWIISAAYVLIIGLLAGSYPAFLMSSYRPILALKSKMDQRKNLGIKPREVLVIFQFAVVVILISSTWIVRDQMRFVQNRDLGINEDRLIFHPVTSKMRENKSALRNELSSLPGISSVSYTFSPLTDIYSDTDAMQWQGKDPDFKPNISRMGTDAGLIATAGKELISGREIDVYTFPSDSSSMMINEKLAALLGFEDPLGQVIRDDEKDYTIVGVVKDFIMESPFDEVKPIAVFGPFRELNFIHLRLNEQVNLSEAMAQIQNTIGKFNPDAPFEYRFVDQENDQKFISQERTAKLTSIFTALSIFISCMGLFGLAAFIVERKKKEISVRKVLGATVSSLIGLISSEFARLVGIAILIGVPITWYVMSDWLETFNYRTVLDWSIFIWTGGLTLLIALLTVSSQAIKAALVNPAKTLKSE
ncbi:ABC transporter permease [Algoriphagus sp. oki45]|uniref:ABC transporter permease n=1 Tax=Algoriphagus sp. oki45 TaxID=3067294 RepID=UPI0027E66E56|nr:ABC transporter permease [Algoriphagus sp. oki45]